MKCENSKSLFSGYIDETLKTSERYVFEHHIEHCADCRRELEEYKAVHAVVTSVTPAELPKNFMADMHHLIKTESTKIPVYKKPKFYGGLVALAASIVLILGPAQTLYNSDGLMQNTNDAVSYTSGKSSITATETALPSSPAPKSGTMFDYSELPEQRRLSPDESGSTEPSQSAESLSGTTRNAASTAQSASQSQATQTPATVSASAPAQYTQVVTDDVPHVTSEDADFSAETPVAVSVSDTDAESAAETEITSTTEKKFEQAENSRINSDDTSSSYVSSGGGGGGGSAGGSSASVNSSFFSSESEIEVYYVSGDDFDSIVPKFSVTVNGINVSCVEITDIEGITCKKVSKNTNVYKKLSADYDSGIFIIREN